MKRSTASAYNAFQKHSIPFFSGGHREDVTPVPIPNTEVKSLIGEGTAGFACGRVARCRIISAPDCESSQVLFLFSDPRRERLLSREGKIKKALCNKRKIFLVTNLRYSLVLKVYVNCKLNRGGYGEKG